MSCRNFFSGMPCSGHQLLLCFLKRNIPLNLVLHLCDIISQMFHHLTLCSFRQSFHHSCHSSNSCGWHINLPHIIEWCGDRLTACLSKLFNLPHAVRGEHAVALLAVSSLLTPVPDRPKLVCADRAGYRCYKLMSTCELLIPFRHEIDTRQADQSDEPFDQHIGPENGPNRCHG
jgi:hypothetical protein